MKKTLLNSQLYRNKWWTGPGPWAVVGHQWLVPSTCYECVSCCSHGWRCHRHPQPCVRASSTGSSRRLGLQPTSPCTPLIACEFVGSRCGWISSSIHHGQGFGLLGQFPLWSVSSKPKAAWMAGLGSEGLGVLTDQ